MSASSYEYKTVALPQVVQAKRRRGVSEADFVAETLGELIHLEAVDGWEYLRADTLAAGSRGGMFSKEAKVTHYSVLVFRRIQEEVWPLEQVTPVDAPSVFARHGAGCAVGAIGFCRILGLVCVLILGNCLYTDGPVDQLQQRLFGKWFVQIAEGAINQGVGNPLRPRHHDNR